MPRTRRFTAGTLLSLVALAGCSDGVVSPGASSIEAPSVAAPAPLKLAPQGRPALALSGSLPDSASADFVVGPSGGIYFAGNHAVVFPAQSICDPATSSYGPATWDQPCDLLQTSLKVHAEVRRANGKTWVDFTPSLRFVPSTNPAKWVWMVMYTPAAIGVSSDLSAFNILWADAIRGNTVDETPTDPTLRTYVDTFQGISLRRIKHFSGYASAQGKTCDPDAEDCSAPPPE
jgi:hypothetical protein